MQIQCAKVEVLSEDATQQTVLSDLFLPDTGILLRNVKVAWTMPGGAGTVTLPNASIGFYNALYETAFTALAVQAVILVLMQRRQEPGSPTKQQPVTVQAVPPKAGMPREWIN